MFFLNLCQGSLIWFSRDIPAILGGVSCKKEAPVFDFCDRIIAYSNPSNVELGFKRRVSPRSAKVWAKQQFVTKERKTFLQDVPGTASWVHLSWRPVYGLILFTSDILP